jgi:Na+/proline symporter
MSTISTHLNWGVSYIVDDFYKRFIAPDRDDRHYVRVARLSTVFLIILAGMVSLWLENALQAFQILLQIGAGTGLIFLLRWFWWRINAWGELAAMLISFLVAIYLQFVHQALGFEPLHPSLMLVLGVVITTAGWLSVTLVTPATDRATLQAFYDRIRPFNAGWKAAVRTVPTEGRFTAALLSWVLGCTVVYAALFGTGYFLYGKPMLGVTFMLVVLLAAVGIFRNLQRVGFE